MSDQGHPKKLRFLGTKLKKSLGMACLLIFAGALLVSCGEPVVNETLVDSGVEIRPLSEVQSSLQSMSATGFISLQEYGKSGQGRSLMALRIGQPAPLGTNPPLVLITDATHGNESVDVVPHLASWLTKSAQSMPYFANGGVALVIPVVNPDGYEYHRVNGRSGAGGPDGGNSWGRMNSNRIDLNRDYAVNGANFAGFSQIETRAMRDLIAKETKSGYRFALSMDYHCCIGNGTLLYPYAYTRNNPLSRTEEAKFIEYSKKFQTALPSIRYGHTVALGGYPATGVSTDYFHESFGTLAFTYEGRSGGERDRVDAHIQSWQEIFRALTPVAGNSDIALAIAKEDSRGLILALAAKETGTAKLCAGASCAESSALAQFNPKTTRDGRTLYLADRGFFPTAGQVYVIELTGAKPLKFRLTNP